MAQQARESMPSALQLRIETAWEKVEVAEKVMNIALREGNEARKAAVEGLTNAVFSLYNAMGNFWCDSPVNEASLLRMVKAMEIVERAKKEMDSALATEIRMKDSARTTEIRMKDELANFIEVSPGSKDAKKVSYVEELSKITAASDESKRVRVIAVNTLKDAVFSLYNAWKAARGNANHR